MACPASEPMLAWDKHQDGQGKNIMAPLQAGAKNG